EARAAALKAVDLDPNDWRHALRLSCVSWGKQRLRAARRVLMLCPGLALAHYLTATVFVARGAFDAALEMLQEGCAAQDAQLASTSGYPGVAMHLHRARVLAGSATSTRRSPTSSASSTRPVAESSTRGNASRTAGTRSARCGIGKASTTSRSTRS